jgi:hypothetical protein
MNRLKPAATLRRDLTQHERHVATLRLLAVLPINPLAYAVRLGIVMRNHGYVRG